MSLNAISPIDGRYADKTAELIPFYSEYALMHYRVKVEIEYFIALSEIPLPQLADLGRDKDRQLRDVYLRFNDADAAWIKETERTTNHDVKAVEYFVKKKLGEIGLSQYAEFVHFGLTSQDVNNTAIPMLLADSYHKVMYPQMYALYDELAELSRRWRDVPMLAHTHGQPASPTRLGKEIQVFAERLATQLAVLEGLPNYGKFGGATGNFNAHHVAYPHIDWAAFAGRLLDERFNLVREYTTTQIDHYDGLAAILDGIKRVNVILTDLCRDMWSYISMNYFTQKINPGEVGSSAMPHKVNPIDFENAEGNFGVANALLEYMAVKLPVSRLQRDLTDSTVLRNLGVPVAHTLIAIKSLRKGLGKLQLHEAAIQADLDNNWAVVAEAVQTVLRRENYPNPYEALKALTRTNDGITKKTLHSFIDGLDVNDNVKKELKKLSPHNYLGIPPADI